jgi:DGQHR domain-containing protein
MAEGWIERRALRIQQNTETPLYLFALAAEEVDLVADVARISRDEAGKLIGYQRPEKKKHVKQIQDYLDSADVLFPNGLILALPPEVKFKSSRGPATSDGLAVSGTLEIPLAQGPDGSRPAWIVDGQQRSLALARTKNKRLPVPVAGFVADSIELQREQFLRVNTVQPLPTNLVTELLPEIARVPSGRMSARQLPSALVDMLNLDQESPFFGLIKRASTPQDDKKTAVVTDTGLVEALKESLESPSGVLFPYRNIAAGTTDTVGIRLVLLTYWTAVKNTFPDAWGLPPTSSRLMGGVGIRAMGRLMERVMAHIDVTDAEAVKKTEQELQHVAAACRWTRGTWPELGLPWDELQNTPRHISALSNFLARTYVTNRMAAR